MSHVLRGMYRATNYWWTWLESLDCWKRLEMKPTMFLIKFYQG